MKTQTSALHFADIVVLGLIFFAYPIYTSTGQYWALLNTGLAEPEQLLFNDASHYAGMVMEILSLSLAAGYLYWRKFDFAQLNWRANWQTLPYCLLFILLGSFFASLFEYGHYFFTAQEAFATTNESIHYGVQDFAHDMLSNFSLPFLFFALLNGFFEEVFFVGLVFCVRRQHLGYAIVFSLLLRFAFHTYQGMGAAMTITTLGISFALLRLRYRQLLPFCLAHSFFDLFGLTFLLNVFFIDFNL